MKRVDFAPIPSPRIKKKARKEQMLLEHKEKGHQALSMVMKQLKKPEQPEEDEEADNDGLQCLDDLCSQSRFIQEDIKKQAKVPIEEDNDAEEHDNKQDEVGVCLFSRFAHPSIQTHLEV